MSDNFRIVPQSAAAAAIREAYDRLIDVQRELEMAGEVADKPHLSYQHILKANNYTSRAIGNLVATQVIKYEQLTIGTK